MLAVGVFAEAERFAVSGLVQLVAYGAVIPVVLVVELPAEAERFVVFGLEVLDSE